MISLKHQFVFIHVQKTGGNSIQKLLEPYSEDALVVVKPSHDLLHRFEVRNREFTSLRKHSTLQEYREALGETLYRKLFKFAAIRNPWDRAISHYFFVHGSSQEWNRENFLTVLKKVKPLRHYITTKNPGEPGAAGVSSPALGDEVDFLLRFEKLSEDMQEVCRRLEIPWNPLPSVNRTTHEHYSRYYDDELIEIVRARFAEEISFGEYEFQRRSDLT